MGLECPCGVKVDAQSFNNHVLFDDQECTIKGDLTYYVNVCISTLDSSFLSLDFEDEETVGGVNSFLFVANEFTAIECHQHDRNCEVKIYGTGIVNNLEYPFVAVFTDKREMAKIDVVKSFIIIGFFDQNGAAQVPRGSVNALGCD